MKRIRISIQRRNRRNRLSGGGPKRRAPMYAGRDCMVGYVVIADMLRLQELKEAYRKADDAFRAFESKLIDRVKKGEKQDIVEAGGDFSTVDVEFYTDRKYLVTWYRFNPNDRRKGAKDTKVKDVKEKK